MYQVCIVDDEIKEIKSLKDSIFSFFKSKSLTVNVDKYDNPVSFLNNFEKSKYDLILLDISMPQKNGIDVAHLIREKDDMVKIIFTTSLIQYAIKGYEVNAFDYLLKPISYSSFCLTMERLMKFISNDECIIISKNKNTTIKIPIMNIKYIEVIDHKVIFHTTGETYSLRDTLDNYIEKLKDHYFSLCNRCYLVNLYYVTKIEEGAAYIGDVVLNISRAKKKQFVNDLNNYLSLGGGV